MSEETLQNANDQSVSSVEGLTFREAMTELNGTVEALESNTLELEES